MRSVGLAALFALLAASIASPTQACIVAMPFDPTHIDNADFVVVGRISRYEIIEDQSAREDRLRLLQRADIPEALRESARRQTGFLSDYARFEITVHQILVGEAPDRLTVTWDNSTFGERESMSGEYLIALTHQSPDPSASATVLQSGCGPAFLFEFDSNEARTIRQRIAESARPGQ